MKCLGILRIVLIQGYLRNLLKGVDLDIMNRAEILRLEREKVLTNYKEDNGNRAKWLTALMDIDDEMEEMEKNQNSPFDQN